MDLKQMILLNWWHAGGAYETLVRVSQEEIETLHKEGVKYENCSNPRLKLFLIAAYYMKPWNDSGMKELHPHLKDTFTKGGRWIDSGKGETQSGHLGWSDFDLELPGEIWNIPYRDGLCGVGQKVRITAKTMIDQFDLAQAWKEQNLPKHLVG